MDQREKNVQRALGTLATFSVRVKVILEAPNREDALKEMRDVIHFVRDHYPHHLIKKGKMVNIVKLNNT